jgi:hypothetical protein
MLSIDERFVVPNKRSFTEFNPGFTLAQKQPQDYPALSPHCVCDRPIYPMIFSERHYTAPRSM